MFDHLMIDKILTKEVEKLVPDDEALHCYLLIKLIQYLLSREQRDLEKNNKSIVLELDNHESYDYNKPKDISQMRD